MTKALVGVCLAIATAAALMAPGASAAPPGYSLRFSDNFNGATGSRPSTAKWRANRHETDPNAITPQWSGNACADPDQNWIEDGALWIVAEADPCTTVWGESYPYRSGLIHSRYSFQYRYGYAEARLWMPAGWGMWPAFWSLANQNQTTWSVPGEIDIAESFEGTDWVGHFYHWEQIGLCGNCEVGYGADVPGATSGWHTYAAKWERGRITWYVDGRQRFTTTQNVKSAYQYIILDLTVSPPWLPVGEPAVPNWLGVDYVRVYQR